MVELNVATWNVEWRAPLSRRAAIIRERLEAFTPDIVCLTECRVDFLNEWKGHTAESGTDWGYEQKDDQREVLLWSRWPWSEIDIIGSPSLPQGRFVRAVTDTTLGTLIVIGIVIPYHFSHVRHGRRDRDPWQEHCLYLDALGPILKDIKSPCIVLGDFNQRIPSTWVPKAAQLKLRTAFADLQITTAGCIAMNGDKAIDHIACHPSLEAASLGTLSNIAENGRQLSDHFGVTCTFKPRLGFKS